MTSQRDVCVCLHIEMKIIMVKSSSVRMWCWQWTRAPQLDILVAAWARAEATAKKRSEEDQIFEKRRPPNRAPLKQILMSALVFQFSVK